MKKYLTIIFFLIQGICNGQNLVPNASFETFVTCPIYLGQIVRSDGWLGCTATPDYFNTCSVSSVCTIPNNIFGYQYPSSGNAYAGFWARSQFLPNYREHLGTHLLSNLQTGTKYYISLKVSLSTNGNAMNYCGINKIGVLFSTIQYDSTNFVPVNNFAHVFTNSIISDTLNWAIINDSFIADSNYSFICIGNFFNDLSTDTSQIAGSCEAYYFLDDVCVSTDSTFAHNYIWTGIPETVNRSAVSVFPNPFGDKLNIKSFEHRFLGINIFDVTSRIILQQTFENTTSIYMGHLVRGIYYYEVHNENGMIQNGTIIKQ